LNKTNQQRNHFELESLESRVLLSGDSVLAAAFSGAAAQAHKPLVVAHQEAAAEHTAFQDSISYHAAESAGMFAGITTEAIQSNSHESAQSAATVQVHETKSTVQTETVTEAGSGQNSTVTVQSQAVQKEAVTPVSTTTVTNSTLSSQSATSNIMTRQLTESLKVSNAPPTSASTSQSAKNQSLTNNTTSLSSSSASGSTSTGTTVSSSRALLMIFPPSPAALVPSN
jgi:hypothetical protein